MWYQTQSSSQYLLHNKWMNEYETFLYFQLVGETLDKIMAYSQRIEKVV